MNTFKLFRFEDEWEYAKSAKAKRAAKKLMDAAVAYVEGKGPLPEIGVFREALNCGGCIVPIWAIRVLNRVLKEHPNPREYALAVYGVARAPARGWFTHNFGIAKHPAVKQELLMRALSDKSAKVRLDACSGDGYQNNPELLQKLSELAKNDQNREVRKEAAWRYDIVKYGYCLKREGKRIVFDRYDEERGCSDGFCVPKAVFEEFGADTLFKMFKANRHDPRLQSSTWS